MITLYQVTPKSVGLHSRLQNAFCLGVGLVLNSAEDVFALCSFQAVGHFHLGPVHNLVHRGKVEGAEEEIVVYLEIQDTIKSADNGPEGNPFGSIA